eukprot:PLAT4411.4.p1 GENE.PLAT4411.4~~PLAT4411.4.p1  ORF type:complete len:500 (+),score=185.46 PLAT4411.4:28-1500(+)
MVAGVGRDDDTGEQDTLVRVAVVASDGAAPRRGSASAGASSVMERVGGLYAAGGREGGSALPRRVPRAQLLRLQARHMCCMPMPGQRMEKRLYAGVMALLLFSLLLSLLLTSWGASSAGGSNGSVGVQDEPSYFQKRPMPTVLRRYKSKHRLAMTTPTARHSRFVVYRPPLEMHSVVECFPGLVSAFLLSLISNRALVVDWQDGLRAEGKQIGALLQTPGFDWSYHQLMRKLPSAQRHMTLLPGDRIETLLCSDLAAGALASHKVLLVNSTAYFASLLVVNPHHRAFVQHNLGRNTLFQDLFNDLVRPRQSILREVDALRQQFEHNFIIGLEMMTRDKLLLSDRHQQLFFETAKESSMKALREYDPDMNALRLFLVSDDDTTRAALAESWQCLTSGDATTVWMADFAAQLRDLWLLGECSRIITTPRSVFGIVGHARTGQRPTVLLSSTLAHDSASSQPCYADYGAIHHTTCFTPTMLSLAGSDPWVPCE